MDRLLIACPFRRTEMKLLTEKDLIEGCKNRDRKVQAFLYRRYYSDFLKVCFRYSANQQDAEQWMNDGFYKIFTRIDQFEYKGSFEGWMKRIVVHTCLDNLRSAIHKHSSQLDEIDEQKAAYLKDNDLHGPIQNLSYKELVALIHSLPTMHKTVFNLYVFDGYSHKEIAVKLNIKEGTSQWYVNQARELLKQRIPMHTSKMMRYDK